MFLAENLLTINCRCIPCLLFLRRLLNSTAAPQMEFNFDLKE